MSQPENPPEYSKADPRQMEEEYPPAPTYPTSYAAAPYPTGDYENQAQNYPGGPYTNSTYQPAGSDPTKTGVITAPPAAYNVVQVVPQANIQACAGINDYMAMNIVFMLCCCLPFGIVAVMKSNECKNAKSIGNVSGATQLSAEAKKWGFITLGFGLVVLSISIGIMIYSLVYLSSFSYYWSAVMGLFYLWLLFFFVIVFLYLFNFIFVLLATIFALTVETCNWWIFICFGHCFKIANGLLNRTTLKM